MFGHVILTVFELVIEYNHKWYGQWYGHGFQNRTGPGGRTVKTGNRDENRVFKPKEPDFLLIS